MTPPTRRIAGLALAAAVFAADQLTKWIVHVHLAMERGDSIPLVPIFALTRTHNYGVSLGMLSAQTPEMKLLLIIVTATIAVGVTVWMMRETALGDILALGMVLGGAAGNIIDRVRFGYVLDFADLHFGEFRPFLIFNVADAAITIGVLIILARSLFMREKPPEPQTPAQAAEPTTEPDPQPARDAAETL